jgi:hypothetical protein
MTRQLIKNHAAYRVAGRSEVARPTFA